MPAKSSTDVNARASAKEVPIACRYPEDRVHMLDAMAKQLGLASRSDLMRRLLDDGLERHFGRAA